MTRTYTAAALAVALFLTGCSSAPPTTAPPQGKQDDGIAQYLTDLESAYDSKDAEKMCSLMTERAQAETLAEGLSCPEKMMYVFTLMGDTPFEVESVEVSGDTAVIEFSTGASDTIVRTADGWKSE